MVMLRCYVTILTSGVRGERGGVRPRQPIPGAGCCSRALYMMDPPSGPHAIIPRACVTKLNASGPATCYQRPWTDTCKLRRRGERGV